jgi:MerC mercury resistance protein
MKLKVNADFLGIGSSVACAIHCAVLPVFLAGLSIFGVNIIHNFWFESGMILFAFAVGISSFRHGFINHDKSIVPFSLFALGMIFLFAKQFWHEFELILLPFALILIILAHIFNFRFIRKSAEKENK